MNIWKYTANGKMALGQTAPDFLKKARELGYKMFTWNGELYRVPNDINAEWDSEPLDIAHEELE